MNKCACPAPTPILDELAGETVCAGCARVLDVTVRTDGFAARMNSTGLAR